MADPRPATFADARVRRVPGHATPLVGRRFVLEQLAQGVSRNFATALWGLAGIGKSRLAHALASRWYDDRPDGDVWVVDLAAATDATSALALIVASIQDGQGGSAEKAELVGRMLARPRPTLLVLDHAEHLAGDVATWIDAWRCDGEGRVVVTTRVRIEGTWEFDVPALTEDDALKLIEQRARRVRDSFRIDAATREDLRRLVRRVDALPGALELLAPRLMLLSPAALAERLEHGQGALHGAIERSWHLLDPREQSVLKQLAATRQGFDIEIAERVVRCDGDVLGVLESLTRHAWVHAIEAGDLRMQILHEPMRFIREQGVDADAQRRHVDALTELGERWDQGIESVDERQCTRRLTDNLPNLWAAWEHANGGVRARLALVLHMALQRCGSPDRQDEITREALMLAADADEPALHARALLARARVLRWSGATAESSALLQQALPLGDAATRCGALRNLGANAYATGDLDATRRWADEALRVALAEGEVTDEINARNGLGFLLSVTDDLDGAEQQLQRALELAGRPDEPDGLFALVSSSLANLAVHRQRWLEAELHSSQALEVYEKLGYQRHVPLELLYRAEARLCAGRLGAASDDIATADQIAGRWRYDSLSLRALYLTGVCAIARREPHEALQALGAAAPRLATRGDAQLAVEVNLAAAAARLLAGATELDAGFDENDRDVVWLRSHVAGDGAPTHTARDPLRQIWVDALLGQTDTLSVDAEGRGFRWSTGEHVDLTRRQALRRILDALAERHGGEPLTLAEIMEAGWPGEMMTVDSGNRRVYVTIKRLRDLGLGDALQTVGDGYMLNPDTHVLRT